jgi:predicted nucleic acid-binding Zn ribbon protein
MPTYEYYCPTNHRTVEVLHGMSVAVATWGEACERAGIDPGTTPAEAPVEKLLGAGMVIAKSRPAEDFNCGNPMSGGGGCCGGGCGMG